MEKPSNVLWIGGPAASGKTTISRLLARRHGLRWYSIDDHTWQYWDRAKAAGIVLPAEGPGEFDRAPMIREDLFSLPWPLVVAEGALVTPDLATPMSHAVWLMPSQQEQQARLKKRHPEGVHHGFLYGWRLIRGQLDAAADATTIVVDNQSAPQTLAAVESLFADLIAAGPTARNRRERQDLLRYANEVALAHAMTTPRRLPAPPGASKLVRTYDCECAAPTCQATVELPASAAAAALADPPPALFAPGHEAPQVPQLPTS